ncbi:hypothetical protein BVRB_019810, partial [Beta vulgaris subsp. vulgaris]
IIAEQMDVVTAFFNAHLTEELYMNTPQGSASRSKFVKLLKSLYGLKQAPYEWLRTIDHFLVNEQGFTQIKSTPCLYLKRDSSNKFCLVGIYADDLPIIGHPELAYDLKSALNKRFNMSDLGTLKQCIGIGVHRDSIAGQVFLEQEKYIEEILLLFQMHKCKPQPTPINSGTKLTKDICPKTEAEHEEVRQLQKAMNYKAAVGHLIWLLHTSPDIAYAVGEVARFV